jgi:hypothetical protein
MQDIPDGANFMTSSQPLICTDPAAGVVAVVLPACSDGDDRMQFAINVDPVGKPSAGG